MKWDSDLTITCVVAGVGLTVIVVSYLCESRMNRNRSKREHHPENDPVLRNKNDQKN